MKQLSDGRSVGCFARVAWRRTAAAAGIGPWAGTPTRMGPASRPESLRRGSLRSLTAATKTGGGGGNRTHVRMSGTWSLYASSPSTRISAIEAPKGRIPVSPTRTGSRRHRTWSTSQPARECDVRSRTTGEPGRTWHLTLVRQPYACQCWHFTCAGSFKRWPTTSSRHSRPYQTPSIPIAPTDSTSPFSIPRRGVRFNPPPLLS